MLLPKHRAHNLANARVVGEPSLCTEAEHDLRDVNVRMIRASTKVVDTAIQRYIATSSLETTEMLERTVQWSARYKPHLTSTPGVRLLVWELHDPHSKNTDKPGTISRKAFFTIHMASCPCFQSVEQRLRSFMRHKRDNWSVLNKQARV